MIRFILLFVMLVTHAEASPQIPATKLKEAETMIREHYKQCAVVNNPNHLSFNLVIGFSIDTSSGGVYRAWPISKHLNKDEEALANEAISIIFKCPKIKIVDKFKKYDDIWNSGSIKFILKD